MKMANLKTTYLAMKKWLEHTGQGVDSGSIEGLRLIFVL